MEENNITISRAWLILLSTILAGAGSFTGYAVKAETGHVSLADIKNIMHEELRPIEIQANTINNQVSVIIYKQAEFERRLEDLERNNRNAR